MKNTEPRYPNQSERIQREERQMVDSCYNGRNNGPIRTNRSFTYQMYVIGVEMCVTSFWRMRLVIWTVFQPDVSAGFGSNDS